MAQLQAVTVEFDGPCFAGARRLLRGGGLAGDSEKPGPGGEGGKGDRE